MKKYYRPEIEEFCIGFECENLSKLIGGSAVPIELHEEVWRKYILTRKDILYFFHQQDELDKGLFRVKYLDQEDILSLGFELISETKDNYTTVTKYKQNKLILVTIVSEEGNTIAVVITYESGNVFNSTVTVFNGSIKNKYELKTLLKYINGYNHT